MTPSHQLISFDLDGTLVDTAGEIAEAANRTLEQHGFARRPVAEITLLIGAGTRELMLKLLAKALLDDPERAASVRTEAVLKDLEIHYAATTGTDAKLYPGCQRALDRLRAAGVRMACVTNKEQHHAERVLAVTGLSPYFDLLIGGDTLPHKKPHASVLQHVAAQFKLPLQAVAHIGDSRIDVESAKASGVLAWAVPYGYNAGRPVAEAQPDRLFDDLDRMADCVLGTEEAAA